MKKRSKPSTLNNPFIAIIINILLVLSSPALLLLGTWYMTVELQNRFINAAEGLHSLIFVNGALGLLFYILTGISMYFVVKRDLVKNQWLFTMIIGGGFLLLASIILFSGWFFSTEFAFLAPGFCTTIEGTKKSPPMFSSSITCTAIYYESPSLTKQEAEQEIKQVLSHPPSQTYQSRP